MISIQKEFWDSVCVCVFLVFMEAMDGSSLLNDLRPPSNHDEIFMQRSLVFADSLKVIIFFFNIFSNLIGFCYNVRKWTL